MRDLDAEDVHLLRNLKWGSRTVKVLCARDFDLSELVQALACTSDFNPEDIVTSLPNAFLCSFILSSHELGRR